MRAIRSAAPDCTEVDVISRPPQLSVLAAALATAGLLTLTPAEATVFTDTASEPTNDLVATAIAGIVGTTYTGCVGSQDNSGQPSCAHAADGTVGSDPADFYRWAGLTAGAPYTLSIAEFQINPAGADVTFDLFNGPPLSLIASRTGNGSLPPFTGFVPASGALVLEVSKRSSPGSLAEGYTALLQTSQQSVPEPASAALLAAGLLGAFVARRRKRN